MPTDARFRRVPTSQIRDYVFSQLGATAVGCPCLVSVPSIRENFDAWFFWNNESVLVLMNPPTEFKSVGQSDEFIHQGCFSAGIKDLPAVTFRSVLWNGELVFDYQLVVDTGLRRIQTPLRIVGPKKNLEAIKRKLTR